MKLLSKTTILVGYVSHFLNIGIGVLILPLLDANLSQERMSLWFSFLAGASLIQVLELGLLPTATRQFAYINSGASQITYGKVPEVVKEVVKNDLTVSDYLTELEIIYRYLSLFLFFVVGGILLLFFSSTYEMSSTDFFSWILFVGSFVISLYFNFLSALFFGRNDHAVCYRTIILQRLLIIVAAIYLVPLFEIMGIAIAFLLAAVLSRVYLISFAPADSLPLRRILSASAWRLPTTKNSTLSSSARMGVSQISAFLVQRFSLLLAVPYLSPTEHANYGFTVTLIYTLFSFCLFFGNAQISNVSHAVVARDSRLLRRQFLTIISICSMVYLAASAGIVFFADFLLPIFFEQQDFISTDLLIFLLIIVFLELIHSLSATLITTFNIVPFAKSAVITAVSVVLLQAILVPFYGLTAILAVVFCCQLVFNNWYWPYYCMKKLREVSN